MCGLIREPPNRIQFSKRLNTLRKEIFRKSIHLCTLFVPLALHYYYLPTMTALAVVLCLYIFAETLRVAEKPIPIIATITAAAARKRDENKFVLGPVTLAGGVLLTAFFFNPTAAAIGISALAVGDGIASLVGKMFGKIIIPFTNGKSAEGSLACFMAVYVSSAITTQNALTAFYLAVIAMIIEMLPLKDFDNLLIPLVIAAAAQFVFAIA